MKDRWCLCEHCIAAIRSRGEKIMTRPMDVEDLTETEDEIETVVCDWCDEDFTPDEMYICE